MKARIVLWATIATVFTITTAMLLPPATDNVIARGQSGNLWSGAIFQHKLLMLEQAHYRGQHGVEARFSDQEVVAGLMNGADEFGSRITTVRARRGPMVLTSLHSADRQSAFAGADVSSYSNSRFGFDKDQLVGSSSTEIYGRRITVTFRARLQDEHGRIHVDPTSVHIGRLPVPVWLVKAKMPSQDLRLPYFVQNLRIENGQLVLAS